MVEALLFIGICTVVYFHMKDKKGNTLKREDVNKLDYLNKEVRDKLNDRIKEMEEDRLKNTDIINWRWICVCGEPKDYSWPKNIMNIMYDTHPYVKSVDIERSQLDELRSFLPRDKVLVQHICGECGDGVVGIKCIFE